MELPKPRKYDSASLDPNIYCKNCGWPVIHICCNDGFATTEPYKNSEWWGYCSNKTCKNHKGEEWQMKPPSFVFYI